KITSQFHTSYKRWEFGLQALHLDRVYSTSDEDIAYALPAYLTFDAQVGYFLNQTKKWHTQAGVYNLNNKLYYAMPDRPMPHRNFTIKLTYTFYIMKKHILSLFVAISLVACSNDHKTVTEQPANYSTGYLVTNEGNFHSNNADITYINANFTDSQNQIFRNVNNRALGDVAQSITQNANYVFVVMNNSNTIEVVNKNTFESVATISENINQPRYATITDNKLWVTNAGNNTISSYNLSDFTPSETISLNFTPELIDSTTDYIYVTTNPWADTHLIVPYSTDTHQPTLTTTLDAPVNGLVKQNDQIFVLSSGENFTQIYKVTSHTSYIMSQNE